MRCLLFVAHFLLSCLAFAQQDVPFITGEQKQTDALKLPPFDSLCTWAIENSALVKMQDALIEKTGYDTKRVKKQWLDAIKFGANIKTGSYGNDVINQVETGYSYGPYVSFSLFELASHGNLVNVYKSEEKTAQFKREQTVFEIRRMVSELYQRVQMHQSILKIRSEALNASYMHVKMAEKEFSQGVIELGELSRVTEIYNKAQTELVLTINDLKSNYQELEQMCGKSFINYP